MIFQFFNSIAGKYAAFDEAVAFAAIYAPLIVALLMAYLFWFEKINFSKKDIAKSLLFPSVIIGVVYVIELYLVTHVFYDDFRTRPMSHYWTNLLISQAGVPAFPAWPMVFSAIFLPVLYQYQKKWAVISSIIVFLGGLSLVIAGVHFLSDILAGWIIGLLMGTLGVKLFLKIPVNKYLIAAGIMAIITAVVFALELSEMHLGKTAAFHEQYITDEKLFDKAELDKLSQSAGVEQIKGKYATNGRMVAVDMRVYDTIWSVNKLKKAAISIVDQLFISHKDFTVITLEVYQKSDNKPIWLYNASVYRNDWVKGGNLPGLKGYGNNYYKLPAD